jgi:hypothetical protein
MHSYQRLLPGLLKQYSISGQESSNRQSLASVPIAEVEARLDELQSVGVEITSSEFYRRGWVAAQGPQLEGGRQSR